MKASDIRREYVGRPLTEAEADADPFRQFARWFQEVRDREIDATAMVLATASRAGRPAARNVLLKGVDGGGFVFYTNYGSRKAGDLAENPRASLLFTWRTLERQVRIDGTVEKVTAAESDEYFATRPLESRWSAHASDQSAVLESRDVLETRFEEARARFGADVPRPSGWGGYRVTPTEFEFWQGRPNRLHDRLQYRRQPDGTWLRHRLAP